MATACRFFLAFLALAAAACRHGIPSPTVERGEILGVLLAPAPAGRQTQSILADGPIAALVANNSMGLVANNSMGLGIPTLPTMRGIQAIGGVSGVPVIGAAVRLLDGQGRPIPGASIGFTASNGAFRILGVPVGRAAVLDAGWSVQGEVRTELAIVVPADSRTRVTVDAPSSVAAARALAGVGDRLERLDMQRVDAAAALLRARPELLADVNLASRASLAAAFEQAAAADPEIAKADPVPDPARGAAKVPEPVPGASAVAPSEPQPIPAAAESPSPTSGDPSPSPTSGDPSPSPTSGDPSPSPGSGDPSPSPAKGDPTPAPGNGDPTPSPGSGDPTPAPDNGDPPVAPGDEFDPPAGWDPYSGIILPIPEPTASPPG